MSIYKVLFDQLPFLLNGLGVAVVLLIALLLVGLVLGLLFAVVEVYAPLWARVPVYVVERFARGVPAVILLFLFYYGSTGIYEISSFTAAVGALGLRSAGYQSQIFRGALQSVPDGQMLAARAIGMSRIGAVANIIVPQALRHAVGPWSNEFSAEFKDTSLAYVIGVVELTRQAHYIISNQQGHTLTVFVFAAFLYFVVNRLGNSLLYRLESRLTVPGFERRS